MKMNHIFQGWIKNTVRLGLVGGLSLLMGFASSSMAQTNQPDQKQPKQKEKKNKVPPLPEGVKLHKDRNIQGVWLADGFNFKGYQTLYLMPIVFAGVERDNEVDIRATAMQELPDELRSSKLSLCQSGGWQWREGWPGFTRPACNERGVVLLSRRHESRDAANGDRKSTRLNSSH